MAILVMCTDPSCGALFDAPDKSAGGVVRCPACGRAQTLAAQPSAAPAQPASKPGQAGATGESRSPAPLPAEPIPPGPATGEEGAISLELVEPAELTEAGRKNRPEIPAPPGPARRPSPERMPSAHSGQQTGRVPDSRQSDRAAGPAAPAAKPGPQSAPPRHPQPHGRPTGKSEEDILFDLPERSDAGRYQSLSATPSAPPAGKQSSPAAGKQGESEGSFAEIGRKYLSDISKGGAGPMPSAPAEIDEEFWGTGEADEQAESGDSGGQGAVLGHRPSVAMVFGLGLVGLVAGLAAGIKLFPAEYLLAAYLGAGIGWMAGFTFGSLLVLGAEQSGMTAICPVCHAQYPPGTVECAACGATGLGPAPDFLAIECMHAGGFALSNPSGMLLPVALAVLEALLVSTTIELFGKYPKEMQQWSPMLIGLCSLVGYIVFSYWMAYLLSAAAVPAAHSVLPRKAPDAPRPGSADAIVAGFWVLCAAAVYILPLLTIPLLPIAMLMLASPGRKKAMNPVAAARAAWRRPKGFVVLWMFLMMWLAGMVLAGVVVKIIYDLRLLLPHIEGFAAVALSVILTAFAVALWGIVAAIFGLAMFRCIAAFGRYSPGSLP